MRSLNTKYKMALKEEKNRAAFEALYSEWSNEDTVAIYQWGDGGIYGAIDFLNLNSAILNRREILKLRADYEEIKSKLNLIK